jgi:hypothetical protein
VGDEPTDRRRRRRLARIEGRPHPAPAEPQVAGQRGDADTDRHLRRGEIHGHGHEEGLVEVEVFGFAVVS